MKLGKLLLIWCLKHLPITRATFCLLTVIVFVDFIWLRVKTSSCSNNITFSCYSKQHDDQFMTDMKSIL
ncbi:hypothetical protein X975_02858, partial [Stegodyphus mimosarum]